jgi:hypothetical protein
MIVDVAGWVGHLGPAQQSLEGLQAFAATNHLTHVLTTFTDHDSGGACDEADANAACRHFCARWAPGVPIYWCRPGCFDSHPTVLNGALALGHFQGACFAPWRHGYALDEVSRLTPYFQALAHHARPAIITLAGATGPNAEAFYVLARRWAEQPVVLSGGLAPAGRGAVLDGLRRAAERGATSVAVDTRDADLAGVLAAIEALGSSRVLFGAGMAPDGTAALLPALQSRISPDDWAAVTHGNAQRLFGLTGAARAATAGATA